MIFDFVTIENREWTMVWVTNPKAKMYLLRFLSTAKFYLTPEMLIKKYSLII